MHYARPHALLNCVAWFSLLAYGNAVKGTAPSEVLSHFARTVGTVLVPTLASELHGARANRSTTVTENRRQIDTRQASPQEVDDNREPARPNVPNGLPFPNQGGFLNQYERTYQYRYPPYTQQISENFFPGGGATAAAAFGNQHLPNGLSVDPRFFQTQVPAHQLAPIQPEIPKSINANIIATRDSNSKDNGNSNANTIQNLDTNVDSKSSAQNRPFDGSDFSTVPITPNQPGSGGLARGGNLRVDNRFSAIDYERIRQNYYSDPPINQQRNYFSSFNEIPFSGGPSYRSPLSERYSNLDYAGGAGGPGGGPSAELRSGNGISGLGDPYFGNFFQGPYQSLNYNSLPGSGAGGGVGGGDGGAGQPFPENFRSGFGGLQYPGAGFNGGFYPGGGPGYSEDDSSLRASSAKETLTEANTAQNLQTSSENSREDSGEQKQLNSSEEKTSSQA